MSGMDAETLTRRLYDVADDHEAGILDSLRDRARITWTCPVSPWTNPVGEDCDDCGLSEAEAIVAAQHPEVCGPVGWAEG